MTQGSELERAQRGGDLADALAEEMHAWEAAGLRRHLVDPAPGERSDAIRLRFREPDRLGARLGPLQW